MRLLAINCGSSSLKTAVIDTGGGPRVELRIEQIGTASARVISAGTVAAFAADASLSDAVEFAIRELDQQLHGSGGIAGVVHRIAHGGSRFDHATVIDDRLLREVESLGRLAPLHNPPAIAALRAARARFASVPHVAVFDTSFHRTLPRRAREYALPEDLRTRLGIRRYGFHGISHDHVMQQVARHLNASPQALRVISCHLGNGASVAAIEYGRSVETSMGMTPLEGLVMGTRPGDVDPGVLIELMRELGTVELEHVLNQRSGLVGLTGTQDVEEIEHRAAGGDDGCRLALAIFGHRVRKYIGAYAATMGGVDAIAFTGGIGEHSAHMRHRCLQRLGFLGAVLDEDRNRVAQVDLEAPCVDISATRSSTRLLVVRADEEGSMAQQAAALLESSTALRQASVPIAVSARHAHLSQATIDRLFGASYRLRPRAALSQTGQYSAQETVTLRGPHGALEHVRLMGPPRDRDQIEVSRSDEYALGVDAPVRISGDLDNTPGITVLGPAGEITLPHGLICARRHIHMSPADAQRLGVRDCETVAVRIDSDGRDVEFRDVMVRVAADFTLELHLDTDEANAAGVRAGDQAVLVLPGHDQSRISGISSP